MMNYAVVLFIFFVHTCSNFLFKATSSKVGLAAPLILSGPELN